MRYQSALLWDSMSEPRIDAGGRPVRCGFYSYRHELVTAVNATTLHFHRYNCVRFHIPKQGQESRQTIDIACLSSWCDFSDGGACGHFRLVNVCHVTPSAPGAAAQLTMELVGVVNVEAIAATL